jgi:archaellin
MNKNLALVVIAMIVLSVIATTVMAFTSVNAQEASKKRPAKVAAHLDAPVAISGDNIYVTWWTNETGNDEVVFRASTDGGTSFGDKINLSNTTDAESTRVEIDSDADSVVVTWWETNSTNDTPVMRVSDDNGETFGPLLQLATNGTIGETTEE